MISDVSFPEVESRMRVVRRLEALKSKVLGFRWLPARLQGRLTRLTFRLQAWRARHGE